MFLPSLSLLIEQTLRSVPPSEITDLFLWGMLAVLGAGLLLRRKEFCPGFVSYTPTLLTTLGILGTFVGIVAGLLDFDTANIDQSISPLLEGLKTAFITSVVGMGASVFFKLALPLITSKDNNMGDTTEVGANEIHKVLKQLLISNLALKRSVAGDHDGSLVAQMRHLRTDLSDRLQGILTAQQNTSTTQEQVLERLNENQHSFNEFTATLYDRLDNFAELLSEAATEQIIAALNQVIADFNNNLTEQFGQNFQELNNAVGLLVQWQANYAQQLAEMHNQWNLGVQGIEQIRDSLQNIQESTAAIPDTMSNLQTILETNQNQINVLEHHLTAFADMREAAVQALPEVMNHANTIAESAHNLSTSVNDAAGVLSTAATQTQTSVNDIHDVWDELTQGMANDADQIRGNYQTAATDLLNGMNQAGQHFVDTIGGATGELAELYQQLTERMAEDSEQISDNYQNAATGLLNGMNQAGQHFVDTIGVATGELAEQYQQLTERMAEDSEQISDNYQNAATGLLNGMNQAGQQFVDAIGGSIEELVDQLQQAGAAIIQNAQDVADGVEGQVTNIGTHLMQFVQNQVQTQTQQANAILTGLQDQIQLSITNTGAGVEDLINATAEQRRTEINNVMQHMGEALAAITNQFTQDYTGLVQNMQHIVNQQIEH